MDSTNWVQLLYQAGPGVAPMVLPLPGGNTSGTPLHLPGALTSDEFMQWAAPRMFQDSQVCGSHPPPSLLGFRCPRASRGRSIRLVARTVACIGAAPVVAARVLPSCCGAASSSPRESSRPAHTAA